jgi:hypothetical protein
VATAADEPIIDFSALQQALDSADSVPALYQAVVDAPFEQKLAAAYLFLGFMVLFMVPPGKKVIKLGAASDNEYYKMSVSGYSFDPTKFQLPLTKNSTNDIVQTAITGKPRETTDWRTLRRKWADPEQTSLNQANSGIAYSILYPVDAGNGGVLMFCYYQYVGGAGPAQTKFMGEYTALVSKAIQGYKE